MRLLIFIFVFLSCSDSRFELQEGDLLFQDSDCGVFCDAIESVTSGYQKASLSHVGIVVSEKGVLKVVEAISDGVVYTEIDSFLNRSYDEQGFPKVIVGRLKPEFSTLMNKAVKFVKSKIGLSYDDVFSLDNGKFYCSELLYEAFKYANNGKEIFQLFPMTFVDPETKLTFESWTNYFNDLNVEIPEGKPGLNPGGLSRSEYIDIIHIYGIPAGMELDSEL